MIKDNIFYQCIPTNESDFDYIKESNKVITQWGSLLQCFPVEFGYNQDGSIFEHTNERSIIVRPKWEYQLKNDPYEVDNILIYCKEISKREQDGTHKVIATFDEYVLNDNNLWSEDKSLIKTDYIKENTLMIITSKNPIFKKRQGTTTHKKNNEVFYKTNNDYNGDYSGVSILLRDNVFATTTRNIYNQQMNDVVSYEYYDAKDVLVPIIDYDYTENIKSLPVKQNDIDIFQKESYINIANNSNEQKSIFFGSDEYYGTFYSNNFNGDFYPVNITTKTVVANKDNTSQKVIINTQPYCLKPEYSNKLYAYALPNLKITNIDNQNYDAKDFILFNETVTLDSSVSSTNKIKIMEVDKQSRIFSWNSAHNTRSYNSSEFEFTSDLRDDYSKENYLDFEESIPYFITNNQLTYSKTFVDCNFSIENL